MSNNTKPFLADAAIIRPILIVLLVLYHAFAIFTGGWKPLDSFPDLKVYWWLGRGSEAFMLESFVFVSGYVFGFQSINRGALNAKPLLWSKFKRLIIPCLLFGFLYIILFEDITQPWTITVYELLNGVGHLWFLPMLFWCFVLIWIIESFHFKPYLVLPVLLLCSIGSFITLPFQFARSLYYMFFFYVGFLLQKEHVSLDGFYNSRNLLLLVVTFLVLFPFLTILRERAIIILQDSSILMKIVYSILANLCKFIYSSVGLTMLLVIVGTALKTTPQQLPGWVIKLGGYCMGVYIFQQFFLKYLYYHTSLPAILGPWLLPWCGFVITLVVSLLITLLFKQTRLGRQII